MDLTSWQSAICRNTAFGRQWHKNHMTCILIRSASAIISLLGKISAYREFKTCHLNFSGKYKKENAITNGIHTKKCTQVMTVKRNVDVNVNVNLNVNLNIC